MDKKLLFIYNPFAGKGNVKKSLSDIVDIFKKGGFDPIVYATQGHGDATRKIIEDYSYYDRIVCCGGDGTLNESCEGYVRSGCSVPLGYIPAGSTNDFAGSMGLPSDYLDAAKVAIGDIITPMDVGKFNDSFFVYVSAFGLLTEVSYDTDQSMKNVLGHAAYFIRAGQSILDIPEYGLKIEADGKVLEDRFIYGMITNSTRVGGMGFLVRGEVDLSDGLFEVLMVRYPDNPVELVETLMYLTHIRKNTDLVQSFQASNIKITADIETPWTLDGEFGGNIMDVNIHSLKHAVKLVTG